jgi:hypothetical protein
MSRTLALTLAILAVTATKGTGHQTPTTPPPLAASLSTEQMRILAGIRADDWRAIDEAGWSRDRIYLEALVGALRRQRPKPGDWTDLQEALARLGDSEQLQVAWCLSINERNPTGEAVLKSIGGWFAIQAYDYLLTPAGRTHWERAMRREKESDAPRQPLEFYILGALPDMVPNPPVRLRLIDALPEWQAQIATWKVWIAEHRDELRLLQPTGEGVDFSPRRCKDGKVCSSRGGKAGRYAIESATCPAPRAAARQPDLSPSAAVTLSAE